MQKNALPPVLFPVRAVLASAAIYGPLLALVALAYSPAHGGAPALLALLPLVALQLALCVLLGYALVQGESLVIADQQTLWMLIIYGVLVQFVGWLLVNRAIGSISLGLAGLILLLEPVITYFIDVADGRDGLCALMVVLAIDAEKCSRNS